MRTEVRISFGWNGLAEIDVTVPPGFRAAGLDLLSTALPLLRDLSRRVEQAVPDDRTDLDDLFDEDLARAVRG